MAKQKDYEIGSNRHVKKDARRFRGGGMGGGPNVTATEKPKNFKESLSKLIRYCRPYLGYIVVALVFAAAATVLTLIGPNQISRITNLIGEGLMGTIDLAAIRNICLWLVALYGASFLLNYAQGFIMATITQRVSRGLRGEISEKINRLPLKYFDTTSTGDVLSRVTNDVDTIGQTLNQSVGSLVSSVVMFLGALIMMLSINVTLALTAVAATIIGFGLMMLIISRSQKYFNRQQRHLGQINGLIEETYAGQHIVKAYNGERQTKEEFRKINAKMVDSGWKSQFMSGLMMPLMSFVGNLGYVAVCVVGAVLAMNGNITFGVIVAFMIYVRLFTQPLSQLAQAATNLQSTAAASERVFEFLEEEELADERHKTLKPESVQGNIEFTDVQFGYFEDKPVIKGFNASVKAGQKVAIVGSTGVGKTTIVNLLMRFYELSGGSISIDGVPIDQMSRESVHDLFCMVLQDTWLFEGTIRENIVYNKQGVADEAVIAACKAVGIDHFIRTLPDGYDTILNDNANLSAGQKQLITIARAMVKNAPLLILDEATSSVDTRTEIQIQKAMDDLTKGRTSFVIAHRLSTIKDANLILVMKDGTIFEQGTHRELLEKGGYYAELYNSQFEDAPEHIRAS